MYLLLLVPIVYVAAVLQTTMLDAIRIGHVEPDLLALVAILWLLRSDNRHTFLVAGGIGLLTDLISAGRVGIGLACYFIVGYGLRQLRNRAIANSILLQTVILGMSVSVLTLGQTIARQLLGEISLSVVTILSRSFGTGLYTAAVGVPVLMTSSWIVVPYLVYRRRRKL